jgi:thiosulfate dehydrogenase
VPARALALVAALGWAAGAAGCGGQSARDYGEALFQDKALSDAKSNAFRCATCHDTSDAPLLRPGYTMHDAAVRPSWWGGTVSTLRDAVNECLVEFMRGRPLAEDDDKGRALYVYLGSLAPDASAEARPLTIVQNIVDLHSGDAGRGGGVWKEVCQVCHGEPHTGSGRLADTVSIVPDESISNHGTDPITGARPVVIEKVRHGKFFGVGGNMAPFSLEALGDDQLGDLLAYLETFGLPASPAK